MVRSLFQAYLTVLGNDIGPNRNTSIKNNYLKLKVE